VLISAIHAPSKRKQVCCSLVTFHNFLLGRLIIWVDCCVMRSPMSRFHHCDNALHNSDKQTQIPADTNFKMTTSSSLRTCAYLWHAKKYFWFKLERETKRDAADGHHTTINFLYKLKLTTQIMLQARFFMGRQEGSNGKSSQERTWNQALTTEFWLLMHTSSVWPGEGGVRAFKDTSWP